MSADELRQAAKTLRERAEGTTWAPQCGGWWVPEANAVAEADNDVARTTWHGTAAYIATMHPGVGLALANLLDTVEGALAAGGNSDAQVAVDALCIARLINGSAS